MHLKRIVRGCLDFRCNSRIVEQAEGSVAAAQLQERGQGTLMIRDPGGGPGLLACMFPELLCFRRSLDQDGPGLRSGQPDRDSLLVLRREIEGSRTFVVRKLNDKERDGSPRTFQGLALPVADDELAAVL